MKRFNVLMTSVVIFISVLAVGVVYMPKIMGLKSYSIQTGSMEPTIKTGSMVFVREYNNFEDYRINDIVTFTDTAQSKSFTHRIADINVEDKSFVTKGDANSEVDLQPTSYLYAVGKVEFTIPYLGYAAAFLRNTVVKIVLAVVYIAWIAIEIELYQTERKKKYD